MHSDRNARLREEFSALLPSSIFTLIRTHRLDQDENLVRRQLALEGILQNPGHVSRELILERLRSPDLGIRSSCIRVLMGYPMDEALPLLLADQPDPYWTRTLFGIAAAAGQRESMFEIFAEEEHGKGFETLLATIETPWPTELSPEPCRQEINKDDFAGVTRRMRHVLDRPWVFAYDRTTALGGLFLLLLYVGGNFTTESTRL